MSDKKKTMRELLEEVRLNSQKISEQEASSPQENRPIRTRLRSFFGIQEPTNPEDQAKDEENARKFERVIGNPAVQSVLPGARIIPRVKAPAAPSTAVAPRPSTAPAVPSTAVAPRPSTAPAAPGKSVTPSSSGPRVVGSGSTNTPSVGGATFRTNTPRTGLTTAERGAIGGGLAGLGVGTAGVIANRDTGTSTEAKPAANTAPPSSDKTSEKPAFEFKSKGGKVSADELNRWRLSVGNKQATLGQYMNARDNLTARAGGKNDPAVIQKKLDTEYEKGSSEDTGRLQAYKPESGTTAPKSKLPTTDVPMPPPRPSSNTADDLTRASENDDRQIAKYSALGRKNNQNEETTLSSPMIEAFLKLQAKGSYNLFAEAKKKQLDPVGKEDDDIDNDGDKDKSDEYLHNRRKAIGKAMKEELAPRTAKERIQNKLGTGPKSTFTGDSGQEKSKEDRAEMDKKMKEVQKEETESLASDRAAHNKFDAKMKTERGKNFQTFLGPNITMRNAVIRNLGDKPSMETPVPKPQPMQTKPAGKNTDRVPSDKPYGDLEGAKKAMAKEEVEFSEAELAHIASIVEAPVAPTPDDYSGPNGGVSKRDLTDETIVETKKKDPSELKKRGRKAGVKVGAYKMKGMDDVEGEEHKAEPKNLVAQNPRTRNENGKNVVDVEHPTQAGVKRTIPAKDYDSFRSGYLNAEKPEHKTKMHDAFVKRVFN